jgi:hypothetical protein
LILALNPVAKGARFELFWPDTGDCERERDLEGDLEGDREPGEPGVLGSLCELGEPGKSGEGVAPDMIFVFYI